jgi:hypothetical protein
MNFKQYILREQEESELQFTNQDLHSSFEVKFLYKGRMFDISTVYKYGFSYRYIKPDPKNIPFENLEIVDVDIHNNLNGIFYNILEDINHGKYPVTYVSVEDPELIEFLKHLTDYKFIKRIKGKISEGGFQKYREFFRIGNFDGLLASLSTALERREPIRNAFNTIRHNHHEL